MLFCLLGFGVCIIKQPRCSKRMGGGRVHAHWLCLYCYNPSKVFACVGEMNFLLLLLFIKYLATLPPQLCKFINLFLRVLTE